MRPDRRLGVRAAVEGVVLGLAVQAGLAAGLSAAGVEDGGTGSAVGTTTWSASLATYVGVAGWRLARGGVPVRAALGAPAIVAVPPAIVIAALAAGAGWAESPLARLAPPAVWLVLNPLACTRAARRRRPARTAGAA